MGRIAVIGGGSWGTALAAHLARRGVDARLWVREPEIVDAIARTRRNAWYLSDIELPTAVRATGDLEFESISIAPEVVDPTDVR